jgi:signal transduction histidine kinase
LDIMEKLMDSRFPRLFSNLGLTAIILASYTVAFYEKINSVPKTVYGAGLIFTVLLYIFYIFYKAKFNKTHYILLTGLILSLVAVFKCVYDANVFLMLWPLVWLIGYSYVRYKYLSMILAGIVITGILILMAPDISIIPEVLLGLVGLYLATSSTEYRRTLFALDRVRLKELDEAHRKLQETYAELQETSVHSMRYAALEERSRLSQEIHDGLGHQLTSLIIQLQALQIMLEKNPEQASEAVNQLLGISRRAMKEVRLAVREWSDDEMGLGLVALKGLISQTQGRSSIQFQFIQNSEISDWPIETSVLLYRVLQESLTNILKHSGALTAQIQIKETDEKIILDISDDGKFTANALFHPGFGINGILERCTMQGGTCLFTPVNPHGFHTTAIIPIQPKPI